MVSKLGIGMATESHAGDPMSGLLDPFCDDDGESSFSGNESDCR